MVSESSHPTDSRQKRALRGVRSQLLPPYSAAGAGSYTEQQKNAAHTVERTIDTPKHIGRCPHRQTREAVRHTTPNRTQTYLLTFVLILIIIDVETLRHIPIECDGMADLCYRRKRDNQSTSLAYTFHRQTKILSKQNFRADRRA